MAIRLLEKRVENARGVCMPCVKPACTRSVDRHAVIWVCTNACIGVIHPGPGDQREVSPSGNPRMNCQDPLEHPRAVKMRARRLWPRSLGNSRRKPIPRCDPDDPSPKTEGPAAENATNEANCGGILPVTQVVVRFGPKDISAIRPWMRDPRARGRRRGSI